MTPFWSGELIFVTRHIDAPSTKADAFRFKPEALFKGGMPAQLNLSTHAQNAMPGQPNSRAQRCRRIPGSSGKPGSSGDRPVSRDHAVRNLSDRGNNPCSCSRRIHVERFCSSTELRYLLTYSGAAIPAFSLGSGIGDPGVMERGRTPAHIGNA